MERKINNLKFNAILKVCKNYIKNNNQENLNKIVSYIAKNASDEQCLTFVREYCNFCTGFL